MGVTIDGIDPGITLPVLPASGGYGGQFYFQRPANTTQYTANDVVGGQRGFIDLGVMGPAGGLVLLQSIRFQPRLTSVPITATMANMRLALYRREPRSAIADNAAWNVPVADVDTFIDIIDLGTPALPAASSQILTISRDNIGKEIQLADNETHLWAYLVTDVGYTPGANSEIYTGAVYTVAV